MRKEHDHKGGLPLLDDVQQNELQPNVITYNAVISAYEKGWMAKRALQICEMRSGYPAQCDHLRGACNSASSGILPNVFTYSPICSRASSPT